MTKKQVFVAMFKALDCLCDEKPSDVLKDYLSGANPYLFMDRESADPVIFAEFVRLEDFEGDLSYEDAFIAVKRYLKGKADFAERIEEISLEEWKSLYKMVETEIPS